MIAQYKRSTETILHNTIETYSIHMFQPTQIRQKYVFSKSRRKRYGSMWYGTVDDSAATTEMRNTAYAANAARFDTMLSAHRSSVERLRYRCLLPRKRRLTQKKRRNARRPVLSGLQKYKARFRPKPPRTQKTVLTKPFYFEITMRFFWLLHKNRKPFVTRFIHLPRQCPTPGEALWDTFVFFKNNLFIIWTSAFAKMAIRHFTAKEIKQLHYLLRPSAKAIWNDTL